MTAVGDVVRDRDEAARLPSGTLCADSDGDPVLRVDATIWFRWCPSALAYGHLCASTWETHSTPPWAFPWRVVALRPSDQPAALDARLAARMCLAAQLPRACGGVLDRLAEVIGGPTRGPAESDADFRRRLGEPAAPSPEPPLFAPGDGVRVARKGGPPWVSSMDGTVGQRGRVRDGSRDSVLVTLEDGCEWYYPASALERVVDEPQLLARGMRVRVPEGDDDSDAPHRRVHDPTRVHVASGTFILGAGAGSGLSATVRVGDVVLPERLPDRAIGQVTEGTPFVHARSGARGCFVCAKGVDPEGSWGTLVGRHDWPIGNKPLRVLALDVPDEVLQSPARLRALLGWTSPTAVRVGDVVRQARLPVGAVAWSPSARAAGIRRSADENDVRYLTWCGGALHSATSGGFAFASDWRVVALGVPADATPESALRLAGYALTAGPRGGADCPSLHLGPRLPSFDALRAEWRRLVALLGSDAVARVEGASHGMAGAEALEAEALDLLGGGLVGVDDGRDWVVLGAVNLGGPAIARRADRSEAQLEAYARVVARLRRIVADPLPALDALLGPREPRAGALVHAWRWAGGDARLDVRGVAHLAVEGRPRAEFRGATSACGASLLGAVLAWAWTPSWGRHDAVDARVCMACPSAYGLACAPAGCHRGWVASEGLPFAEAEARLWSRMLAGARAIGSPFRPRLVAVDLLAAEHPTADELDELCTALDAAS